MKWFLQKPEKSFTLVELLVVVAVIGLLVSILMPALHRARATSQRTACRANLHQAGLAFQAYLDTESHDIYPDAVLLPSFDKTAPGIATVLKKYLGDPKILKCPNDRPNDTTLAGTKDLYFNVEGTSYEYPPPARNRKASSLLEDQMAVLFDFEAFHGPEGEKGCINFLNADGSVDE
jgi:prepilin-type N-terminal cleavage/methylation domain-containing protein